MARLLGREPAGAYSVVVRRRNGTPAVIENDPILHDGRPMPTRYWLVDPGLRSAVSRLEADGGVRRAAAEVSPEVLSAAHAAHAAERTQRVPLGHIGPVPTGGVGGTRRGVKCLHAHLAWYLAGGDDPVGRWTADQLGVDSGEFAPALRPEQTRDGPVAAIDCGTNSTRLIVADEWGSVLEREMQITRLGEGVDANHRLSREAIARTLTALQDYRRRMDRRGVKRIRAVATSAVRDAANSDTFMNGATAILGVTPEVLTGEEEGRLAFAGATAHLPEWYDSDAPVLVVDIGGGSTELSVGRALPYAAATPEVRTMSLDAGCVRISERFLRHDPPSPKELTQARRFVEQAIDDVRRKLPPLEPGSLFVGLAGTVSTLACLQQGLTEYDRSRIHHSVLDRGEVALWLEALSAESATARLDRPGMVQGREDVIVGGTLILSVIMELYGCNRCLVSEDDILDGLISTLSGR